MNAAPTLTADAVALANHEAVHQMTMCSYSNEERILRFRAAFEDYLPAAELTDRQIISAMCTVELECYS